MATEMSPVFMEQDSFKVPSTLLSNEYNLQDEKEALQEKCGIVGIFTPDGQSHLATLLLAGSGVQHRGQKGVGIASYSEEAGLDSFTHNGLFSDVFEFIEKDEDVDDFNRARKDMFDRFNVPSLWKLLHGRYGTNGDYKKENLQPCIAKDKELGEAAVIHNGEFVEVELMDEELKELGIEILEGASDTYKFTKLLEHTPGNTWDEKIATRLSKTKGAYSLIIGAGDSMYVARDEQGIRPMVIGQFNDGSWIVTSETHALQKAGINPLREVRPGEFFKIDKHGLAIYKKGTSNGGNFCEFEWVYFAFPGSMLPTYEQKDDSDNPKRWIAVERAREKAGITLAQEAPVPNARYIFGVPDSGVALATGFAIGNNTPYRQLLLRNHYDLNGKHRLFQGDEQKFLIKSKVLGKLSFIPDEEIYRGGIFVVVDDSIVRGNVMEPIIEALLRLGASEVHVRTHYMPSHKCHLGVSMRSEEELIAAKYNGDMDKIAKAIGATSVRVLSNEGIIRARQRSDNIVIPQDPADIFLANHGCGGCVTGRYPIDKDGVVFKFKLR